MACKRITMTMDEKLLKRLDEYCDNMGTNRSSLIAVVMGQYLAQMEKAQLVINSAVQNLIDSVAEEKKV